MLFFRFFLLLPIFLLFGCAQDQHHKIVVSVSDQKIALFTDECLTATYPISTSKYGIGDAIGSYATPLGQLIICKKIGSGAPLGMVFKDRKATGEILPPNSPERDPVVTRILWLQGREAQNRNAFKRFIYIHGTPQERLLGFPKSYGCIRMASSDITKLYDQIGTGTPVEIRIGSLPKKLPLKDNN